MNQYRRKLLNAILLFSKKKVKHLNTTKLSKLLWFFDFQHARKTGYPSTGLQYNAFEQGPVPKAFWLEIKDGQVPEDFQKHLDIIMQRDDFNKEYKELIFRAKRSPDMNVFTPREHKILEDLVYIYKDATAKEMSESSHLENEPWHITYNKKGKNALIDYGLAVDSNTDESKQLIREYFEDIKNFKLSPVR